MVFGSKAFVTDIASLLLLLLASIAGFIIHAPLYWPLRGLVKEKTVGTVFYHSALFTVLIIIYPAYCFLLALVVAPYCIPPIYMCFSLYCPFWLMRLHTGAIVLPGCSILPQWIKRREIN
jgi:hypothetical protein